MQYYAAFAACVALAAAQSTVTGPPMGVYRTVDSAPAVTATTVLSVATALPTAVVNNKRDVSICVAQPAGIPHATLPDTAESFLADSYYSGAALSAVTPSAYNSIYINNNSSNNADLYMGYTLMDTYDVQACAAKCDAFTGCSSFNVYFERDPSVDPNDASCINPTSVTHVKCVWWGSSLTTTTAVNDGQWRGEFHVVIAGSNAYNKIPVSASTSSGFATSTRAATATSSATTSAAATSTPSTVTANTNSAFYIQVGNSGSSLDTKYVTVASNGAISYAAGKSTAALFVIDASGNLVSKATGLALNLTYNTGAWQKIYFNNKAANKAYSYASCSIVAPYVQCNVNSAFQFAGVCNNDGALYFGVPAKIPSVCRWAGLYPISA